MVSALLVCAVLQDFLAVITIITSTSPFNLSNPFLMEALKTATVHISERRLLREGCTWPARATRGAVVALSSRSGLVPSTSIEVVLS